MEGKILKVMQGYYPGYIGVEHKLDWNGYEVYEGVLPKTGEVPVIGTPMYALVKNDEARLTTVEEGFDILNRMIDAEEE